MLYSIILFVLTYVLMLAFDRYRPIIALVSAAIFVFTGMLPMECAVSYVDWNVLMMIAGTMGTVALLIESKMPALIADLILEKVPNVKWAIVTLSLFAGIVSAFIDNVATVLPVTRGIAAAMGVDPTLLYFGLLSGATLGGNLTPVGASANITGIGILRKVGYTVKNSDFLRIGIPFTFAAIIPAYLYFWILYR